MNCFIITGFASSEKGLQAANIYTGNDGVEAAEAALAAAKTGRFVKIGKLVNPSMAPLPTREYKLEVSGAPKPVVVAAAHKPPVGASLNPKLDKQHNDLAAERERLAKADAEKIAKAQADQLVEMRAREKKIEAERQRQQRLAPDIDGGTDGNSDPIIPVTKPVESNPEQESKPESKPQEPQQTTSETASATPTLGAAKTDKGENKKKKNETEK